MKKLLVFTVILVNLVFGAQGFSRMNSKEFEKIMEKVAKEYDKGNKQKALSMLKENIRKNPSDITLKVMLGILYDDMGRKNESEKELNEAIEMQKKYPFIADDGGKYDIRLMIGTIYMFAEKYEKALKWINEVDDKNFEKLNVVDYLTGRLNYELGNVEEAKKILLKSYVKDEDGSSEQILGQIYYDEGNQKEAMKWFLAADKKNNFNAQASLGFVYFELGDKVKALQWLRKALGEAKKAKEEEQVKEIQNIIKEVESSN